MIKLVVADMDGTLLNSNKELSPKLFPIIERLHEKGIKFAVASGRQYYNLLKIYDVMQSKMTFIAENGAIVFDQGKNISYSEMAYEAIEEILNKVSEIEGAYPVLCGLESAYIQENLGANFEQHVGMYYARYERVTDLLAAAKKDRICKVAIYDETDAERNTYPKLEKMGDKYKITVSGHEWVDLVNPTVNKGVAIKKLQKEIGITEAETMAFGDYLNDYEMMQSSYYSYAMANAHPDIKVVANFEALSNDEDGVCVVLEDYLNSLK